MRATNLADGIENLQFFRGRPELVSFPSTSEMFHAVFENNFYATCIGNANGQTLEANEKACKIFGYTPAEMLKLSTKDLFDTKAGAYINYISERKIKGKTKAQLTGARKNGDLFACIVTSFIFYDDNGDERTMNSIQDISKNYVNNFSDNLNHTLKKTSFHTG
ncbi:MAG: PAS domain-containing protein [Ginsengibacter sp.]